MMNGLSFFGTDIRQLLEELKFLNIALQVGWDSAGTGNGSGTRRAYMGNNGTKI